MNTPLKRYEENPVLTPERMPFECYTVMNAAVTRVEDKVLLLLRVEDFKRETAFYVAASKDGIHFEVDPAPVDYPWSPLNQLAGGIHRFDMRITQLDGTFYVCNANWIGQWGCVIDIAKTSDFKKYEWISSSVPSNRNAVLFPEKINGKFARLERPQNIDGTGRIWYSESPDLIHWGRSFPVDLPVTAWSLVKSGAGITPIKTPAGWLEIYHATSKTASSENYYLGACLLDLHEPWKVVAAPKKFILAPEKEYECVGQTPNVVFTCGGCEMPDGSYYLYYAGADTRICLAKTSVEKLLNFCSEEY